MKKLVSVVLCLLTFVIFAPQSSAQTTKQIQVDLSEQRLKAYENGNLVYNFPVSSGTWRYPTPTGGFWPWIKLTSGDMEGGSRIAGDYYYLPDVPYIMYFYNENVPKYRGYAIHGTYWHNNFGTPMSHGCINLSIADARQLFYWADVYRGNGEGTMIVIKH